MRHSSVLVLTIIATSAASSVLAGTRDNVMATAVRCAAITDDQVWLDCYYGAAQPMRAQLGLKPAPQSQLRLVPATIAAALPRPLPTTQYAKNPAAPNEGLFTDLFGGEAVVSQMGVNAYSFDRHNKFTVTLADGEIWEQQSGDAPVATWDKPASRYLVSIRKGALGSNNLQVGGDNNVYKVRRIR
ncbi:MAG TPA: hypothetical protein VGM26_11975 [Rhizomicrobium sp.]|jgi:hypothetical protein